MPKKIHLGIDLSFTHSDGRWRTPGSWAHRIYPDLTMFEDLARIAERGCLDMIFFGDGTGIPATWRGTEEAGARWGIQWPRQDMSPYITAMSRVTKHVGFGLTYSSTFMHPFYVARLLNSLDHVTNGRIAFNVVTSTRRSDAANYGFDELMEHNSRYNRMEEFIDICKALWSSVEPDAFVWDRESGAVVEDPSKVRAINHSGPFFKVKGPLPCVPSPQGRPVLIQAGGSPRGIRASAHFADHVFGAGKALPLKVKHRAALEEALVAEGRDPKSVGILWDIILVVAETEAEAIRRKDRILSAIPLEGAGAFVSEHAGYDFSKLPARFKLRELNEEIAATQASPVGFVSTMAYEVGGETEVTREEFFERAMKAATSYDHTIAGTPKQVADYLEEQFEATGCRGGFMIAHPMSTPGDLLNVVDLLVPELQRRGRFRREYEGGTLMENLAA